MKTFDTAPRNARVRQLFENDSVKQSNALGVVVDSWPASGGDFVSTLKNGASNLVNSNEWMPLILLSSLAFLALRRKS